jgi:hypothetical protein
MLPKGLGKLKKKKKKLMTSGIEPATSRVVALSLNQLRYRVPHTTES